MSADVLPGLEAPGDTVAAADDVTAAAWCLVAELRDDPSTPYAARALDALEAALNRQADERGADR